jgi:hypothetical protein
VTFTPIHTQLIGIRTQVDPLGMMEAPGVGRDGEASASLQSHSADFFPVAWRCEDALGPVVARSSTP